MGARTVEIDELSLGLLPEHGTMEGLAQTKQEELHGLIKWRKGQREGREDALRAQENAPSEAPPTMRESVSKCDGRLRGCAIRDAGRSRPRAGGRAMGAADG